MQKALFLDRDGVINNERGDFTYRESDFKFCSDVFESLKIARDKGYLLIIITNQSGIARGIYTKDNLFQLHAFMSNEFKKQGIEFDAIYACPHHPEQGECLCRKPKSLLVEKAIARFNIHPSASYFIGDRERDAEAARSAGVNPILIESNSSLLSIINDLP
jgi:D-glycero-D-manno-heptose 1,7-bisphosphate phosphatase